MKLKAIWRENETPMTIQEFTAKLWERHKDWAESPGDSSYVKGIDKMTVTMVTNDPVTQMTMILENAKRDIDHAISFLNNNGGAVGVHSYVKNAQNSLQQIVESLLQWAARMPNYHQQQEEKKSHE